MKTLCVILLTLSICIFSSCKKNKITLSPDARVSFSSDSVLFDTVFTSIGSATKIIRIRNQNNQKITINSVYLQAGQSSPFILNLDGTPGKTFSETEIAANDSMYLFIQVKVDPTNANSPLIISDKIIFEVNGAQQSVYLEAWGQDAYYHYPTNAIKQKNGYLPYSIISSATNTTVTWNNDKPHVIYGWLVVDSAQTLIINQGVRIYMHQNAALWIYRYGTIKINGTKDNEVTFQGDRRESDYQDKPGQWDRILINEGSLNNSIDYAIIKNAYIGIQAGLYPFYNPNTNTVYYDASAPKKLNLTNSIIKNCSGYGLYAESYDISAGNNLVCNTQNHTVYLSLGGKYDFTHCTFANYWSHSNRENSTLYIDNGPESGGFDLDFCNFKNCIVDGSLTNEITLNMGQNALANYSFSNCLIKTNLNTDTSNYTQCLVNQPAAFDNPASHNFKLTSGSAAINLNTPAAISNAALFPLDIEAKPRLPLPDAGAFEF